MPISEPTPTPGGPTGHSAKQNQASDGKGKLAMPRVYSAPELLKMTFPEPRWAVPGLLPVGLALLAGKPKLGKSWCALGLGLSIGFGGRALGKIQVAQGEVLYLALEDRYQRLQNRLTLLAADGNVPADFLLNTDWPRMGKGGLQLLAEWAEEHSRCRLIIIDTLVKFRRRADKQVRSQFDEDYATGEAIKVVADKYGLCILVIAHLRKMAADDVFDQVSGTLGLTAAADTVLVLTRERGQADAVLHVTGRDVDETDLALRWDPVTVSWNLLGDAAKYKLSKGRLEIVTLLESADKTWTPKEVAASLDKQPEAIKLLMWRMSKDGEIRTVGYGQYMSLRNTSNSGNSSNSDTLDTLDTLPRVSESSKSSESIKSIRDTRTQHSSGTPNGAGTGNGKPGEFCLDCSAPLPPGWVFRCPACEEKFTDGEKGATSD